MALSLRGTVALVTGGPGGIGAAVVRRLAAEGAHVAIADLHLDRCQALAAEVAASGGAASSHRLDVASSRQVSAVLDDVEASAGAVTLAVTAAGVIDTFPFLELPDEAWDRTLEVNLKGTFNVIRELARRLTRTRAPGSIVAVASIAARGGRPSAADYAASKAGVVSVARSAALALAPSGIRVNAVCPGVIDTDMTQAIHRERARLGGIAPDESLARMAATIPLGRVGTPDEVAAAIGIPAFGGGGLHHRAGAERVRRHGTRLGGR